MNGIGLADGIALFMEYINAIPDTFIPAPFYATFIQVSKITYSKLRFEQLACLLQFLPTCQRSSMLLVSQYLRRSCMDVEQLANTFINVFMRPPHGTAQHPNAWRVVRDLIEQAMYFSKLAKVPSRSLGTPTDEVPIVTAIVKSDYNPNLNHVLPIKSGDRVVLAHATKEPGWFITCTKDGAKKYVPTNFLKLDPVDFSVIAPEIISAANAQAADAPNSQDDDVPPPPPPSLPEDDNDDVPPPPPPLPLERDDAGEGSDDDPPPPPPLDDEREEGHANERHFLEKKAHKGFKPATMRLPARQTMNLLSKPGGALRNSSKGLSLSHAILTGSLHQHPQRRQEVTASIIDAEEARTESVSLLPPPSCAFPAESPSAHSSPSQLASPSSSPPLPPPTSEPSLPSEQANVKDSAVPLPPPVSDPSPSSSETSETRGSTTPLSQNSSGTMSPLSVPPTSQHGERKVLLPPPIRRSSQSVAMPSTERSGPSPPAFSGSAYCNQPPEGAPRLNASKPRHGKFKSVACLGTEMSRKQSPFPQKKASGELLLPPPPPPQMPLQNSGARSAHQKSLSLRSSGSVSSVDSDSHRSPTDAAADAKKNPLSAPVPSRGVQLAPPPVIPGSVEKHGDTPAAASREPEPPSTPGDEYQKNMRKRTLIFQELVSTEKTYLDCLNTFADRFEKPIKKDILEQAPDETTLLFSNLDFLIIIQQEFYKNLCDVQKEWNDNTCVSECLLKFCPKLKMYHHYIENYGKALKAYARCLEKKEFRKFVDGLNYSDSIGRLSFESLLICPVQRIPRYVLLFNDLFKHTPETHPDYPKMKELCEEMQKQAESLNEEKRKCEEREALQSVQEKLDGFQESLITPDRTRKLIREVECKVNREKAYAFFFSDICLVTKKNGSRYIFKRKILVNNPIVEEEEKGVLITLGDQSISIPCKEQKEKELWKGCYKPDAPK